MVVHGDFDLNKSTQNSLGGSSNRTINTTNLVISDGGKIGTSTTPDAITIESNGNVTFTGTITANSNSKTSIALNSFNVRIDINGRLSSGINVVSSTNSSRYVELPQPVTGGFIQIFESSENGYSLLVVHDGTPGPDANTINSLPASTNTNYTNRLIVAARSHVICVATSNSNWDVFINGVKNTLSTLVNSN